MPFAIGAAPLVAQQSDVDRGGFVVTLGNDTISAESFTRVGSRVEGMIARRSPRVAVVRYVMDLASTGLASRIEYNTRLVDGGVPPNAANRIVVRFTTDSVVTEIHRDTVSTARVAIRDAFPEIDGAVSFYALPVAALTARRADSAMFLSYPAGAPRGGEMPAVRRAAGRFEVYSFGSPNDIDTDASGRLLAVDGSRTTFRIKATRQPSVDVLALARAFAERERVSGPMTALSPRVTGSATIGPATISVDYGSPAARGRTIWGSNGVLGDTLWRTGANASTQFKTDAPLRFGALTLPAGEYTLTTLAIPGRYHLIFAASGAEVLRVPLQSAPLAPKQERFTIGINDTGQQSGVVRLRWDALELSASFTTGQPRQGIPS